MPKIARLSKPDFVESGAALAYVQSAKAEFLEVGQFF
jgi:hypothetical protein